MTSETSPLVMYDCSKQAVATWSRYPRSLARVRVRPIVL